MKDKIESIIVGLTCIFSVIYCFYTKDYWGDFISFFFGGGLMGYLISKFVIQEPIDKVVKSYTKPYDEKDNNFCDKVKEHMDKLQQEIERNFKFNKKVDVDKYRQKILSDFNSIYHKTNGGKVN